uniref:Calcium-transporting ATPase n=1 Tax=Quercus lobata TaxID=97700 RepID=A0A7N2LD18_QUELO
MRPLGDGDPPSPWSRTLAADFAWWLISPNVQKPKENEENYRVSQRALAVLQVVKQLISNVVGTFHNEFPSLVSQPNDVVVKQVVAKGDFEDSLNLKGGESSSKCFHFPPSCVLVNEGRNHGIFISVSEWGDNSICGWSGQPPNIPDVDEFSIPNPPSCTFFDHPQAAIRLEVKALWFSEMSCGRSALRRLDVAIRTKLSFSSHQTPLLFHSPEIVFCFLLYEAWAWKNLVFLSPSLSQCAFDLCPQCSSSSSCSRFCYTSCNVLGHAFWGIKATPYSPARFNDGFSILPFSPYGFKMKTLTLGSTFLDQRRARPPLLPLLETIRPFAKPILFLILSMRIVFDFVSDRKMILGLHRPNMSCSALTDRGVPSPRQFQLKGFMARGGAASQPPPIPNKPQLCSWDKASSIAFFPPLSFENALEGAELSARASDEKIRVAVYVNKAALQFVGTIEDKKTHYKLSNEVRDAGFGIEPDELASIVRTHDSKGLVSHGGLEGLARELSVSLKDGVVSSDIPLRQNIYGLNRYVEKPSKSLWMFVWDALHDLTLVILMVCAVISIGVGIPTEGWPKGMYDGVGILLCIFLVVLVTAISDYRQSLQFRDLDKEKKNIIIQVTRDGYRQKVSIYDLVAGDVVHLSIGDQVPADGVFISGHSLSVDESSLSGESEAVNVTQETPFLLAGTKVQDGSGKMLVASVGMRTEWGRLMVTLSEGGDDETPLQVKLNGVATIIGKIGLAFAVLTFLVLTGRFLVDKALQNRITVWSGSDALKLLNYFAIAVTILVVAVPEGLPLAVTLSLAFAMKKLMSDKALVRHLSACETMGSVSCICTDKTGTLTANHMVVNKIWICQKTTEINSRGSEDVLNISLSEKVLNVLLQSIFQNTSSEVVKGKDLKKNIIGTPTETALMELGMLLGGDFNAYREEDNIVKVEPFNSNKKTMSVLVALPGSGGFQAFCKGASEIILKMCDKIVNAEGEAIPLSEEQRKDITDVINNFSCEALRTLCLAFKDIKDISSADSIPEDGYTLISVIGIKDPVRLGVREAVETCLAAGITVRMVTGDNINTAKAIAKECGILTEDGIAIEGPDFRNKSPQEMKEIIPKLQVMARSLPLDKHTLVTHLRNVTKEVVAVTGDGTNDAPALHEADIGLAMGIAGTEVAKENADVIVMDDNFSTIVNVARWGRSVYINIQKFVQFQLTVNVVALMLNFICACVSGSTPLTTVQMLWVNLIMDTLGALALATEPPHEGLMKRPPVGRDEKFITRIMWRNIVGQSIFQILVLLIFQLKGEQLLKLTGSDADSILKTFIFNSFVFCQVFNEINSRDMEKINVFRGIFDSWIFLIVIISTVAFQFIIVEFLGTFADTVPLSWELWLASILIGAASLIIAVVLKCIPVRESKLIVEHHDGYEPLPTGPELA